MLWPLRVAILGHEKFILHGNEFMILKQQLQILIIYVLKAYRVFCELEISKYHAIADDS